MDIKSQILLCCLTKMTNKETKVFKGFNWYIFHYTNGKNLITLDRGWGMSSVW